MAAADAPHPIALVRRRLQEAGLERLLVTPIADIAPKLFRFSRRGARLAERLGGDRPSLMLSSALAELTGQVGEVAKRGGTGARALPTVLVDRLAFSLHGLIDAEAARPVGPSAAIGVDAPPPVPATLRPLLVAVEALQDGLARGLDIALLPPLWRRRSRVTIDEGKGEGSIGAGFFFTDDQAAVPAGIFLAVSGLDDGERPLAFVGVRGPLPSTTAQWYAADRIKDVVMEPLFDEGPRLARLAGGRFGALLAALDDLVVVDADRPRLAWVYAPARGLLLPAVRGHAGAADAAVVELVKGATRGKVSAKKIDDAVRAIAFATDDDRAFAAAQSQRGRATGEAASLLLNHPFVEDEAGVALRVVAARPRIDLDDDGRLRLSADGRALDAGDLTDGHALVHDPAARRLLVVRADTQERALARAVVQLGNAPVPLGVRDAVARRLRRSRVEVALPEVLRGREDVAAPTVVVLVACVRSGDDPLGGGARFTVRTRPLFGGATYEPGSGGGLAFADRDGASWCRRDLAAERVGAATVLRAITALLGDRDDAERAGYTAFAPTAAAARAVIAALATMADVEVAVADDAVRVASVRAEALRVRYHEHTDWIGVDGEAAIGEHERVELAALVMALREGRRYVVVDGDRLIALHGDVRERLAPLAAYAQPDPRGLQLRRAAAAIAGDHLGGSLDRTSAALVAAGLRCDVDDTPSPRVQAALRPYQRAGLRFLRRLVHGGGGAVLADDMGLGKTLVAIALLCDRADEPAAQLVVAPTSLLHHWAHEIARFAPSLRPVVLSDVGGAERAEAMAHSGPGDVVITSYGLAVRDVEALAAQPFATLLLDEAQAVKNAATARAQALRRVRAPARVALTGTPLENHTGEVWSLLDLVVPGVFGTAAQFRARFAEPIEKDLDDERRALLARALRPFVLRRTKAQVAPELPPRIERTVELAPSPEERAGYERLRRAVVLDLEERGLLGDERSADRAAPDPGQARVQILSALTRLRLMACHPALGGDVSDPLRAPPATKHKALVAIIDELRAEGHAALVFSQFVTHLSLAERYAREAGARTLTLTGDTDARERQRLVERFQAGEADVFFISLKAGGFGLNLTRATTVVHLDPWWNPAVEDQASDRAHRIGQSLPVTIVRLVVANTIEALILELHVKKRALADAVLAGSDAAGRLDVAELAALLRGARLTPADEAVVVVDA